MTTAIAIQIATSAASTQSRKAGSLTGSHSISPSSRRNHAFWSGGRARRTPSVVWLVQILEDAGFADTATTLENAMRVQALEPALTVEDHDAILAALGTYCPSGLASLRRELLEDDLRRRR